MLVKPDTVPSLPELSCPFCKGGLEFQISDTFKSSVLTFHCLNCKKKFIVTSLEGGGK